MQITYKICRYKEIDKLFWYSGIMEILNESKLRLIM